MSSDASVLPHRTPQGTGKGYGRHVHKKDSTMDIDYAKHVPGYDRMSRPQKYRARKSVKQVRFFVFRARGTHVDEIPGGFRFHVASLRFVPLTPPRNPPSQMILRMEHDRGQQAAVKNTAAFAKKAFAFFQECVDACEEPECVEECKVEWDM
jgi:hypothetical protein